MGVRFNSQDSLETKGQTGFDYTNFALNLWDYESNINRIVREKLTKNEVPVEAKLHAILDQLYEKKMRYGETGYGKRGQFVKKYHEALKLHPTYGFQVGYQPLSKKVMERRQNQDFEVLKQFYGPQIGEFRNLRSNGIFKGTLFKTEEQILEEETKAEQERRYQQEQSEKHLAEVDGFISSQQQKDKTLSKLQLLNHRKLQVAQQLQSLQQPKDEVAQIVDQALSAAVQPDHSKINNRKAALTPLLIDNHIKTKNDQKPPLSIAPKSS